MFLQTRRVGVVCLPFHSTGRQQVKVYHAGSLRTYCHTRSINAVIVIGVCCIECRSVEAAIYVDSRRESFRSSLGVSWQRLFFSIALLVLARVCLFSA